MNEQDFKNKWLSNAFYWVKDEKTCIELQKIMQQFGISPHYGSKIIEYHDKFHNLVTFKPDQWHDFEYYQRVDMFIPDAIYGEPKNYQEMIDDYITL